MTDHHEIIDRLSRMEERQEAIGADVAALKPKFAEFEAWRNRVAGAQHIVSLLGSALVALLTLGISHWLGSEPKH